MSHIKTSVPCAAEIQGWKPFFAIVHFCLFEEERLSREDVIVRFVMKILFCPFGRYDLILVYKVEQS